MNVNQLILARCGLTFDQVVGSRFLQFPRTPEIPPGTLDPKRNEIKAKALQLKAEGFKIREIARILKRSGGYVSQLIKE